MSIEELNDMIKSGVVYIDESGPLLSEFMQIPTPKLNDDGKIIVCSTPGEITADKTATQIIMSNPIYYLNTGEGWAGEMDLDELQTWYFIEFPHTRLDDFHNLIKKMENGAVAHLGGDMTVQKNKHFGGNEIYLPDLPDTPSTEVCDHKDKYINNAGGTKFWYCPSCKSDLGDYNE